MLVFLTVRDVVCLDVCRSLFRFMMSYMRLRVSMSVRNVFSISVHLMSDRFVLLMVR